MQPKLFSVDPVAQLAPHAIGTFTLLSPLMGPLGMSSFGH